MKELQFLNKYFYKYKYQLLLGILITIIARVFSLVMPEYVQYSLDAVENHILAGNNDFEAVKKKLINYILIIVGSAFLSEFLHSGCVKPLLIFLVTLSLT